MVPVFDIEVMDWSMPIAIGFYDGQDYHEFLKDSEEDDVAWDFLKDLADHYPGITLYAHNAANFDNKFILDSLCRHNQEVRFPSGLAKMVWVEPNIAFQDSYTLLCSSLSSVCKAFDVSGKLEWDHSDTVSVWEMKAKLDSFRAYLKRDCLSLSECLGKYCKMLLGEFNITPSSTLALTSVKALNKVFFPVRDINANEEFETYIRRATYGGRNEVYKKYGEKVNLYDVRSMFVSCYDADIPVGKMKWVKSNLNTGTLAEAKIYVPDMLIGPLPYRLNGKLIFPVGEFQGWWDMNQLRMAAELGCEVTIIRQLGCPEEPILKEFGEVVGHLRESSNPDLSKLWKKFGLRLTGKFGQHRTRSEIRHVLDIEDQVGWCPIDDKEIYYEKLSYMNGHRSPYIKPAVNMRIRSEAEIRHFRVLLGSDPYYCDTDSDFTNKILPTGNKMGDLRLIDYAKRAYFIRRKFYGYVNKWGLLKQRTSGFKDFKLTESDFTRLSEGQELLNEFEGLSDWKGILKGKGLELVTRHRKVSSKFDSSNRIDMGKETVPIKLVGGRIKPPHRTS